MSKIPNEFSIETCKKTTHLGKCIGPIERAIKICGWIYGNRSKSHIGSYEIINFKDFNIL